MELARLDGIQRAPILHHFAESFSGAVAIRAFDQECRFTDTNLDLIDYHSRPCMVPQCVRYGMAFLQTKPIILCLHSSILVSIIIISTGYSERHSKIDNIELGRSNN
ncbi:hypothetical protein AQUCO_00100778v1 [Aquilegia coerulea]|uniref:ABC transmembrane type-1 domain-containing protein n=1 Tax=Aquilegia coerulea TaxID=218851 RepID=A0A2G5FBY9_AQUCA|nr:hypothetical protein AQUCO_00100778v1 [Aquilegia coerulea]